jgi:hypothetical protein
MTLNEFIAAWNGRGADYDKALGYQCMDLFLFYQKQVLGVSPKGAAYAALLWNNYDPNVFERIPNSLSFVPRAGDVCIWGATSGNPYGHVAIATGSGNLWSFSSFDQNWPLGSLPHIQSHNYFSGFKGVLRPKVGTITTPTPAPASTSFTVKVNKASAAVRTAPNASASLGGSQVLYYGTTFIAVGTVVGQNIGGNNIWYKSAKGNYVWSGGLVRI